MNCFGGLPSACRLWLQCTDARCKIKLHGLLSSSPWHCNLSLFSKRAATYSSVPIWNKSPQVSSNSPWTGILIFCLALATGKLQLWSLSIKHEEKLFPSSYHIYNCFTRPSKLAFNIKKNKKHLKKMLAEMTVEANIICVHRVDPVHALPQAWFPWLAESRGDAIWHIKGPH